MQLQAICDTTHINCSARLSEYLGQIANGLRSKAAWAEELLEYGNNILFPDCNESDEEPTGDRARGAAGHILTPVQFVMEDVKCNECGEAAHQELRTEKRTWNLTVLELLGELKQILAVEHQVHNAQSSKQTHKQLTPGEKEHND
ncbi:hypothetical protein B0H14DRAFT_2580187 [Mycena olivaceomarginata]|nr:hypothetical protein B0H14DRAFT_2580187 [Mycena olivaceomarginata]